MLSIFSKELPNLKMEKEQQQKKGGRGANQYH